VKAYQIVIKDNEISEEYAEISRESFRPAIEEGIIDEIVTFDAITPDCPQYGEEVQRYAWEESLMLADTLGQNPDDHSPTEKAGMCSHWKLMEQAGKTEERFFVMEHDTFLLPDQLDTLRDLIGYTKVKQPHYVNIGLFMGMYSLGEHCAKWMHDMLVHGKGYTGRFPINCGPYCTLQRLFRTYSTHYLQDYDFFNMKNTAIHPWHGCDTLYFGKTIEVPFNEHDPDPKNSVVNPTTQVISKRLCVTQDHHGYSEQWIEQPWTRHHYFHVID
jgi:hypothetical protein